MKKRVALLLANLFVWVSLAFAQDVPVGVIVAFKKGNSQELNRYLGDKVDLIIQNRSTNMDKQLAENVDQNGESENASEGLASLLSASTRDAESDRIYSSVDALESGTYTVTANGPMNI